MMRVVKDLNGERKKIPDKSWCNPLDPLGKNISDNFGKKLGKFIPGCRQAPCYPQLSTLTRQQHQQGLRVLTLRHRNVQPKNYGRPSKADYRAYEAIKGLYEKEQNEYVKWAKQLWINGDCIRALHPKPVLERLYEAEFRMRARRVQSLPQKYAVAAPIPLETNTGSFELEHAEDLIDVNVEKLPPVDYPEEMDNDFSILMNSCPVPKPCREHPCNFVLPNEDSASTLAMPEINRELAQYAVEHGSTFIASESALRCLMETERSWKLPVSVEEVKCPRSGEMKTVIVVGSEFAVQKECAPQRTYKAYKHLLQHAFAPSTSHYNIETPSKQSAPNKAIPDITVTECPTDPTQLLSHFVSLDDDLAVTTDEDEDVKLLLSISCLFENNRSNSLSSNNESNSEPMQDHCKPNALKDCTEQGDLDKISVPNNKPDEVDKPSSELDQIMVDAVEVKEPAKSISLNSCETSSESYETKPTCSYNEANIEPMQDRCEPNELMDCTEQGDLDKKSVPNNKPDQVDEPSSEVDQITVNAAAEIKEPGRSISLNSCETNSEFYETRPICSNNEANIEPMQDHCEPNELMDCTEQGNLDKKSVPNNKPDQVDEPSSEVDQITVNAAAEIKEPGRSISLNSCETNSEFYETRPICSNNEANIEPMQDHCEPNELMDCTEQGNLDKKSVPNNKPDQVDEPSSEVDQITVNAAAEIKEPGRSISLNSCETNSEFYETRPICSNNEANIEPMQDHCEPNELMDCTEQGNLDKKSVPNNKPDQVDEPSSEVDQITVNAAAEIKEPGRSISLNSCETNSEFYETRPICSNNEANIEPMQDHCEPNELMDCTEQGDLDKKSVPNNKPDQIDEPSSELDQIMVDAVEVKEPGKSISLNSCETSSEFYETRPTCSYNEANSEPMQDHCEANPLKDCTEQGDLDRNGVPNNKPDEVDKPSSELDQIMVDAAEVTEPGRSIRLNSCETKSESYETRPTCSYNEANIEPMQDHCEPNELMDCTEQGDLDKKSVPNNKPDQVDEPSSEVDQITVNAAAEIKEPGRSISLNSCETSSEFYETRPICSNNEANSEPMQDHCEANTLQDCTKQGDLDKNGVPNNKPDEVDKPSSELDQIMVDAAEVTEPGRSIRLNSCETNSESYETRPTCSYNEANSEPMQDHCEPNYGIRPRNDEPYNETHQLMIDDSEIKLEPSNCQDSYRKKYSTNAYETIPGSDEASSVPDQLNNYEPNYINTDKVEPNYSYASNNDPDRLIIDKPSIDISNSEPVNDTIEQSNNEFSKLTTSKPFNTCFETNEECSPSYEKTALNLLETNDKTLSPIKEKKINCDVSSNMLETNEHTDLRFCEAKAASPPSIYEMNKDNALSSFVEIENAAARFEVDKNYTNIIEANQDDASRLFEAEKYCTKSFFEANKNVLSSNKRSRKFSDPTNLDHGDGQFRTEDTRTTGVNKNRNIDVIKPDNYIPEPNADFNKESNKAATTAVEFKPEKINISEFFSDDPNRETTHRMTKATDDRVRASHGQKTYAKLEGCGENIPLNRCFAETDENSEIKLIDSDIESSISDLSDIEEPLTGFQDGVAVLSLTNNPKTKHKNTATRKYGLQSKIRPKSAKCAKNVMKPKSKKRSLRQSCAGTDGCSYSGSNLQNVTTKNIKQIKAQMLGSVGETSNITTTVKTQTKVINRQTNDTAKAVNKVKKYFPFPISSSHDLKTLNENNANLMTRGTVDESSNITSTVKTQTKVIDRQADNIPFSSGSSQIIKRRNQYDGTFMTYGTVKKTYKTSTAKRRTNTITRKVTKDKKDKTFSIGSSHAMKSRNKNDENLMTKEVIIDNGVNNCTCKGTVFEMPPPRSYKKWRVQNCESHLGFNVIVHSSHKVRKDATEVLLEPIVEYQPELGGTKQSAGKIRALALSLMLRQSAELINVRVDHDNGEVIVIDQMRTDEFVERHGDKSGDVADILHTTINQLRSLKPGQYVLAHDSSQGSNAMLYSSKGAPGSAQTLSLHSDNINIPDPEEALIAKIPPQLEPSVLPYHKHRNTLPLAFTPYESQVCEDSKTAAALPETKLPLQANKWVKQKKTKKRRQDSENED